MQLVAIAGKLQGPYSIVFEIGLRPACNIDENKALQSKIFLWMFNTKVCDGVRIVLDNMKSKVLWKGVTLKPLT
jgi:hypothetical protein